MKTTLDLEEEFNGMCKITMTGHHSSNPPISFKIE